MRELYEFGGIFQYNHPPLLQADELILLSLLKGYRIEMILGPVLEFPPPKFRLLLSVPHRGPPEVGFLPKVKPSKTYPPLFGALYLIKQFFHTPDPIFKSFRVQVSIKSGWMEAG